MNKLFSAETIEELSLFIKENITYGFVSKDGNVVAGLVPKITDDYEISTPFETLDKGVGLCIDTCEVIKAFLKSKNYNFEEYLIGVYVSGKFLFHTFIILKDRGEFIWIEHSLKDHNDLYHFDYLDDAFKDVKDAFIKSENITKYDSLILSVITNIIKPGQDRDDLNKIIPTLTDISKKYGI